MIEGEQRINMADVVVMLGILSVSVIIADKTNDWVLGFAAVLIGTLFYVMFGFLTDFYRRLKKPLFVKDGELERIDKTEILEMLGEATETLNSIVSLLEERARREYYRSRREYAERASKYID